MKNLIENLRNSSAVLRNVEGENETTLMLDQAAGAIEKLQTELVRLKQQEPVAVVQHSVIFKGNTIIQYEGVNHLLEVGAELYLSAGAQPVPETIHSIKEQS